MEEQRADQYRELKLGLIMYLLFLPELILFLTLGTERISRSPAGIVLFFIFSILLYGAVPLLTERKFPAAAPGKKDLKSFFGAISFALLFIIVKMLILKQDVPKFIGETMAFYKASGTAGLGASFLQHLYYLAEMLLCCYMLRLFQEAGERLIKPGSIPYGGMMLGLLWGLAIHTISKGFGVGFYMLLLSMAWGIIYLLSKKNRLLTYVLMAVMFIC